MILRNAFGGGATLAKDIFNVSTYTGTGAARAVATGLRMTAKGGTVWMKRRNAAATDHAIYDTGRGVTKDIGSDLATAQTTQAQGLTAFSNTGFSLGTLAKVNLNTGLFVAWSWAKSRNFHDVVTYTGNGANRTIAHALGSAPGMILIKRLDLAGDWQVYHRSIANTDYLVLNTLASKVTDATRWNSTTATASVFSLGTAANVNTNLGTYVALLFGHDTSPGGNIQCGSYVGNGNLSGPTIMLGWQPQYVLIKNLSSVSGGGVWTLLDSVRGFDHPLAAETSNAEATDTPPTITVSPTGFQLTNDSANTNFSGDTYIYMAVRS